MAFNVSVLQAEDIPREKTQDKGKDKGMAKKRKERMDTLGTDQSTWRGEERRGEERRGEGRKGRYSGHRGGLIMAVFLSVCLCVCLSARYFREMQVSRISTLSRYPNTTSHSLSHFHSQ